MKREVFLTYNFILSIFTGHILIVFECDFKVYKWSFALAPAAELDEMGCLILLLLLLLHIDSIARN